MATKTKVKVLPLTKPKTDIELIIEHFAKYVETTKAIVADYIGGPDMELELQAANDNFFGLLQDFTEDTKEYEFDELIDKLKDMRGSDLKPDALIELLEQCDESDIEVADLLTLVDKIDGCAIGDKLRSEG